MIYREQFSGLEGAPTGGAIVYSSNLKDKMGFGFNLSSTEVGLIRQSRIQSSFSYKVVNSNGHRFALGVLAGVSSFSINNNVVSPESFNDPILVNLLGNNGSAFSIDLGLSYRYKDFQLDFAAPTIVNQSLSDDEYVQINEDNIPDYIADLQYTFLLNVERRITLTPNVTWRYREVLGSEIDELARIGFNNKFSVFGGYRGSYGFSFGAGVHLSKNLEFTYNYDVGDPEIPFLSDGFTEIGLHLTMKTSDERNLIRYQEGEAVYNRVIDDNIYDPSLLTPKDKLALKEFLYSLDKTGKKKDRKVKAEDRHLALFDRLKSEEKARLEAIAATNLKNIQGSLKSAKEEQARLEAKAVERKRLAEEQRLREVQLAANKKAEEESEEFVYKKATELAIAKLSPREQERVKAINMLVGSDRLSELGSPSEPNFARSMKGAYIVVIASYKLDSKYSRLFLNTILEDYPDAKIFASRKRKLDYVYVGQYDDYDKVMARMRQVREDTRFKDAWVHIVRLSELN